MSQLKIVHWPSAISVGPEQTLLDAALAAGVPLPFSCMSGECGSCRCRLLDGEVLHDAHNPHALSPAERDGRWVLACCARPAGATVCIEAVGLQGATPAPARHGGRVISVAAANHDVVRLRIGFPDAAPAFAAGQFARLRFDGLPARSYSMANAPGDASWEFHVRRVPGGRVSEHVFGGLRVGDAVEVDAPHGNACWSPGAQDRDEPLLLVGGGTGLAPVLSILRAACANGRRVEAVYHGVRTPGDRYDEEALGQFAAAHDVRIVPVYSAGEVEGARCGPVHVAVGQDFASLHAYRLFIAGPPPMVDAMRALATARGALPQRVHADAFHAERSSTGALRGGPSGLWQKLRGALRKRA